MHLSYVRWRIQRNIFKVWFHSSNQVRVEGCDKIVVVFFLGGLRECGPWEVINIPCMREVDIWETKGDCALRLG